MNKILYWISTGVIFLLFGVGTALTMNSDMAIQAILDLGYPEYFATMLNIFKILGAFVLIIPLIPARVKEWAYAGFGIDFIAVIISMWVVEGFSLHILFPSSMLVLLILSNVHYYKLRAQISFNEPKRKN